MRTLQEWQDAIPVIRARRRKAEMYDRIIPGMLYAGMVAANGDAGRASAVAGAAAEAAETLDAKVYATGLVTNPGDPVVRGGNGQVYLYSGTAPMTHSNPLFFPGASGVYYWAIVPRLYKGIPVFPHTAGIVVFVKRGSVWWDPPCTATYKWDAADYNCPSVHYPGAAGVHQWAAHDMEGSP